MQTLVLSREKIVAPEFCSIEEWLGRNTSAYYDILALVGKGSWNPKSDAHAWVKFNLTAHHMQAQTVLRRVDETRRMWLRIMDLLGELKLHERLAFALYPAVLGLKVRRSSYERDAELEPATAGRDLRTLVSAGYLEAVGETKARIYVATPLLRAIRNEIAKDRIRPVSPYSVELMEDAPRPRRVAVTTENSR